MLHFLRRSKSNRKPSGNPVWMSWLVFFFVAYVIYGHYTERNSKPDSSDSVLGVTMEPDDGTAFTRADFGSYSLPRGIVIGGDIPGQGEEARCGQTARLRYVEMLPEGIEAPDDIAKEMQETSLQVGIMQKTKPWVLALPGMKSGGVREIKVQGFNRFDKETLERMAMAPSDYMSVKVELEEVQPTANQALVPFQATDRNVGSGDIVSCGANVTFHLTLWNMDGSKAYDSKIGEDAEPLSMRVGDSEFFYGLDRAMLNMRRYGKRNAIIPPGYATLSDHKDAQILTEYVTGDRLVIADIYLLDVTWD